MGIFNNPLSNSNFFKFNEIIEKKLSFLNRDNNRFSIFETENIDVPENTNIFDLDISDVPYSELDDENSDFYIFDYEDAENNDISEFEYFKKEQEYNQIVGSLEDISNISVVKNENEFISIDGSDYEIGSKSEEKAQLYELANKSNSSLAPSPENKNNYNKSVWKTVQPKESGSGKNKKYTYTLSDGTTIEVASTKGVQITENKKTGEIVVIGVKNAKIDGDQQDSNITVYNSTIDDLDMGMGQDKITIKNSTVKNVDGGSGIDVINIENSTVTGTVSGGKGDDYILFQNSKAKKIDGKSGNDNFLIRNSSVQELFGGSGDDLFVVEKSTVKKLDGGKGTNILEKSGSTINSNSNNGNIKKVSSIVSGTQNKEVKNLSNEILNNILSYYFKNPESVTEEQKMQVLALNEFDKQLKQMEEQFNNRNDEDGFVSTGYNMVKILMDAGVSSQDIQKAISEQKQMVEELKKALKGKGDLSFEEVYKKWTGVDYSPSKIKEHIQVQAQYEFALSSLSTAQKMSNDIKEAGNLKEVFNIFVKKYGDKETARKEMNKLLVKFTDSNNYNTMSYATQYPAKFYIDKNFKFVQVDRAGNKRKTDLSKTQNYIGQYSGESNLNLDEYLTKKEAKNVEKILGVSIEDLAKQLKSTELKSQGYGNSLQKVLDKYCKDQEEFPERVALAMDLLGIAFSGLGAAGSLVKFGVSTFSSISKIGSALLNASSLTGKALSLLDDLSSKKDMTKNEAYEYVKDTLKSYLVNVVSGKTNISKTAKSALMQKFNKDVLPILKEMGADSVLSMISEFSATGEIDFKSLGTNQLLALATGLAGINNK